MSLATNIKNSPELTKRLLFTLFMLGVGRIGVHVPTPGINIEALRAFMEKTNFFNVVNLFNGGALDQFSIFALGIMPYISASIIFQLLTVSIPSLKRLQEEGESGRQKINQWTRYATVVLSLIQGLGISYGLYNNEGMVLANVSEGKFIITTMITLSTGTCFIMWMGEQITERGIGNGISLWIFAGIVSRIPSGFRDAWSGKDDFLGVPGFALLLGFIFLLISAIIFFERCQRRIPVQYAKRVVGRKVYGQQSSHLPLKINMAGVIPPIFASSILLFPTTLAGFTQNTKLQAVVAFMGQGWFHNTLYVLGIIFFTYFYTAVIFNPQDVADNLQKHGGFVPGIRPGKSTSEFLDRVLTRITLGGALYLAGICVLPQILTNWVGIPSSLAFTFGGTSLLIVVGVAMDTVAQVESHLLARNYEGFLGTKTARFKGRRA